MLHEVQEVTTEHTPELLQLHGGREQDQFLKKTGAALGISNLKFFTVSFAVDICYEEVTLVGRVKLVGFENFIGVTKVFGFGIGEEAVELGVFRMG